MKLVILFFAGLACSVLATPAVDPKVFEILNNKDRTTVIVSFKKSDVAAVRNKFSNIKSTLTTRSAKLNTFYYLHKDHADTVQENVRVYLEERRQNTNKNIKLSQSWLTNQLIIEGIDKDTILALEKMEDIKEIAADNLIPLRKEENAHVQMQPISLINATQWNMEKIRAPQVWAAPGGNKGEGVVVGTISSGVRVTHEALRNNHREEYGWFDPPFGGKTPNDNSYEGTDSMGIICGQTNGIGIAPEAKWISCRGCTYAGCQNSHLLLCGNFMACPTDVDGNNPNCAMAPNLVSNTWGGGKDGWFHDIVSAWALLNIAPIFPEWSYYSGCKTVIPPGDSADAIGVSGSGEDDSLSIYAVTGPSKLLVLKPDVVAPGSSSVYTARSMNDESYWFSSGAYIAQSHVAGIAALAYGKNPDLTFNELRRVLFAGAQHDVQFPGKNCEGIPSDQYPNNDVGWGRVDALGTFNAL